jgi:ATP-dependent RNA helicase DeaD
MPEEVRLIIKKYLAPNADKVEINKNALVNANITHQFIRTSIKGKLDIISDFLESNAGERGIIFCRTKAGTQNLTKILKEEGFSVDALEGDMQQKERDKVMRAFKNKSLQVLISTDVSARGIDVKNLGFVIHHQLPEQMEYYTHRSGRTARAGKRGFSIALILPHEMDRINNIENSLGIKFRETRI